MIKDSQQKLFTKFLQQNQKLSDELQFGISFQELQNIIERWNGSLKILTHKDEAFIQILLPNDD